MAKICCITMCESKVLCKDMCNRHYLQTQRHGRILDKTIYQPRAAIIPGDGTALLPLGLTDEYAVVDECYAHLDEYKWCKTSAGYAHASIDGSYRLLHRHIMGYPKLFTDHKNHDRLDNRMSNLRACTPSQNSGNTRHKVSKSGYRGVKAYRDKWLARIADKHLGVFQTAEDAALAYNKAAVSRFGEFATLNNLGD
jgi:hypothetical protein